MVAYATTSCTNTVREVAFSAHDIWEKELIDISSREIGLEPVLGVLFGIVIGQACGLGNLVVLVVASKNDDRRVVTEAADVEDCLLLDRFEEGWEAGVIAAGEHEVLPHKHAQFVAGGVKRVVFVNTTAPYSRKEDLRKQVEQGVNEHT